MEVFSAIILSAVSIALMLIIFFQITTSYRKTIYQTKIVDYDEVNIYFTWEGRLYRKKHKQELGKLNNATATLELTYTIHNNVLKRVKILKIVDSINSSLPETKKTFNNTEVKDDTKTESIATSTTEQVEQPKLKEVDTIDTHDKEQDIEQ